MGVQEEKLVEKISEIYDRISKLPSLCPSKEVNTLFTELVLTCIPPSPIDVSKLGKGVQEMRAKLIQLCGEAEGLLESHYSDILANTYGNPIDHLNLFPYYSNYVQLSQLEYTLLVRHVTGPPPTRVAFVGSGPLPLSSLVLATRHMKGARFHNYDVDPSATARARRLVRADPVLGSRVAFRTADLFGLTRELAGHDVVFLAALVGVEPEEKLRAVEHLARHMAPGAYLVLRSAHGARAFLYPVVEPGDLKGFEVLSVYHPSDEVINSVMIARKLPHGGVGTGAVIRTCKCREIMMQGINHLGHGVAIPAPPGQSAETNLGQVPTSGQIHCLELYPSNGQHQPAQPRAGRAQCLCELKGLQPISGASQRACGLVGAHQQMRSSPRPHQQRRCPSRPYQQWRYPPCALQQQHRLPCAHQQERGPVHMPQPAHSPPHAHKLPCPHQQERGPVHMPQLAHSPPRAQQPRHESPRTTQSQQMLFNASAQHQPASGQPRAQQPRHESPHTTQSQQMLFNASAQHQPASGQPRAAHFQWVALCAPNQQRDRPLPQRSADPAKGASHPCAAQPERGQPRVVQTQRTAMPSPSSSSASLSVSQPRTWSGATNSFRSRRCTQAKSNQNQVQSVESKEIGSKLAWRDNKAANPRQSRIPPCGSLLKISKDNQPHQQHIPSQIGRFWRPKTQSIEGRKSPIQSGTAASLAIRDSPCFKPAADQPKKETRQGQTSKNSTWQRIPKANQKIRSWPKEQGIAFNASICRRSSSTAI